MRWKAGGTVLFILKFSNLEGEHSNIRSRWMPIQSLGGGGGGDTPLYKPYRYVSPHRVGVLRRFGLKTGIHFAHFGLESGMVVEGTTGVYERIYRFSSK